MHSMLALPTRLPLHRIIILVISLLVGWSAQADSPRCGDGKRAKPDPQCVALEGAEQLSSKHPFHKKAVRVFRKVARPVEALTGRRAAMVLLAEGSSSDSTALICPGAPPVVYVPFGLLQQVYGQGATYPEDFLAFVIGHELGHRINDFTRGGCPLAMFERPGKGAGEEHLADFRGAFYAAIAGFSPRRVAKKDLVTRFLAEEAKVRGKRADKRKQALLDALNDFEVFERVYEAALSLALAGELDHGLRLIGWATEQLGEAGVPLPEVALVEAMLLTLRAGEHAPWQQAGDGLRLPLSELRCRPVFPAHSALWQDPRGGHKRSTKTSRDQARRDLLRAEDLLRRAQRLGGARLPVYSARACVAFYLGAPAEAARWHEKATHTAKRAPASIQKALIENAALIEFGAILLNTPPKRPGFAAALAKHSNPHAHPRVAAVLKALKTWPKTGPLTAAPNKALSCRGAPRRAVMTVAPVATRGAACAPNWTADLGLPTPDSPTGVVMCVPPGAPRDYALRVRLPATTEPRMHSTDITLRVHRALDQTQRQLDTWACHCDAIRPAPPTDQGEEAWLAACPAMGIDMALIIARGETVQRVIAVHHH